MKKWTQLDQCRTPGGKTLTLVERDGCYTIRIDGAELMSTRCHASEEHLAALCCANLKAAPDARVLIGGLGFGFTLHAALQALPADAVVVVAELLPAVIRWNQNPGYRLAASALADPRVTILERDVGEVIAASPGGFDAIMLDVDNGPAALSANRNARLYQREGLSRIKAALRPGGCVGIWSATGDERFGKTLAQAGFAVEVVWSRANTTSGSLHALFIGKLAV